MTLIACVDDNGTMLFNNRRVSKDVKVIEDIVRNFKVGEKPILMTAYSSKMFPEGTYRVVSLADSFSCDIDKIYFVEEAGLDFVKSAVDRVVLYNWGTKYPIGVKFDFDLSDFELRDTLEFEGKSHKVITRSVYVKC